MNPSFHAQPIFIQSRFIKVFLAQDLYWHRIYAWLEIALSSWTGPGSMAGAFAIIGNARWLCARVCDSVCVCVCVRKCMWMCARVYVDVCMCGSCGCGRVYVWACLAMSALVCKAKMRFYEHQFTPRWNSSLLIEGKNGPESFSTNRKTFNSALRHFRTIFLDQIWSWPYIGLLPELTFV